MSLTQWPAAKAVVCRFLHHTDDLAFALFQHACHARPIYCADIKIHHQCGAAAAAFALAIQECAEFLILMTLDHRFTAFE